MRGWSADSRVEIPTAAARPLHLYRGAAVAAFNGLLKTYDTTELVAIQYHLHIPSPDPLANEDSIARADFYGVRGTPASFFDGKAEATGGGGVESSETKYRQYQAVIDKELKGPAATAIEFEAERSGDKIVVQAAATLLNSADRRGESQPRLRLALTERAIRYVAVTR